MYSWSQMVAGDKATLPDLQKNLLEAAEMFYFWELYCDWDALSAAEVRQ